jgi:LEA14-like dessication related protein
LRITNKSDIDLLATGETFDIYINNNFVAKLNQSNKHVITRNSSTDITLTANFDPSNLVKQGFAAIAQDFNQVRIRIKGKFNIKTSIISVNNLSIDTSMTLAEILAPSNQQTTSC